MMNTLVWRRLLDESPIAIALTRLDDSTIIYANPLYADVIGQSSAEALIGARAADHYVDSEDRDALRQRLSHDGVAHNIELRLRRADGEEIWAVVSAKITSLDGEQVIIGTFHDVTERKAAEEAAQERNVALEREVDHRTQSLQRELIEHERAEVALKASETRFRNLIEGSIQGIIVHRDDRVLLANQAMADILGYDDVGQLYRLASIDEYIHPDDLARTRAYRTARLAGNEAPNDFEIRVQRRNGVIRWINCRATIVDWDGEPAIQAAFFDVSEHHRAEAERKASEQRFKDFANAASDRYWETDAQHRFTYLSQPTEFGGFASADMYGKARWELADLYPLDGDWTAYKEAVAARQPVRGFRNKIEQVGFPTRYYSISGIPFHDQAGEFLGYRGTITDITEQVESDLAARSSQERLGFAIGCLSQNVVLYDSEDRLVMSNGIFEEFDPTMSKFGKPGTRFEDFLRGGLEAGEFPQAVGREEEWFRERMDRHNNPCGPFELERAGNRWLLISEHRMPDGGLISLAADVTERKHAEESLRRSEASLADAQQIAKLGSWERDVATGDIQWSDEEYRLYGYEPNAVAPTLDLVVSAVHPEDRERFLADRVPILPAVTPGGGGSDRIEAEYRIIRPDGTEVMLQQLTRVLRDEDGRAIRLVGTDQDITERKRVEERLRESQGRLRGIIENSPDSITLRGRDGRFQMVNKTFLKRYGLTEEQVIGHTSFDLHPQRVAEHHAALEREIATSGAVLRGDKSATFADGSEHILTVSRFPVFDGQGRVIGIGAISVDVTEQRHAEEELRLAKEAAETANRAKSEFLSSMSHELRTPLNAILGFGQLLTQYSDDPLTEEQGAYVEHMIDGAKHLLGLINEVLDLAKIEAGQLDLSLESIEPRGVVEDSVTLVRSLADGRGISVIVDVEDISGLLVKADANRLKQVFLNVLSNAVKYNCEKGTIAVNAKVVDASMMRINITDTGPGIPADRRGEVFRPFSRLDMAASKIEGTGIGLTISRQLIESMGGNIDFESVVGEGSNFWIDIPIVET